MPADRVVWLATRLAPVQQMCPSTSGSAGRGELREDFVYGGDVSVPVAEVVCSGEDLVGGRSRGERGCEFVACLAGEADVLVHKVHVEPGLVGVVEHEWESCFEHRG